MSLETSDGAAIVAPDVTAIVETPAAAPQVTESSSETAVPAKTSRDTLAAVFDSMTKPRDANGKFAAAGTDQADTAKEFPKADDTAQASPATAGEAPKQPVSWPKDKADLWQKLDPSAREYILQREGEVERGFAKNAERFKPFEGIDELFQPLMPRLQAEGLTPVQAIQRLVSAQAVLDRDPIQGLQWLARSYGVTFDQVAQAAQQTATQPTDPRVESALQRVERMEREFLQQREREASALQSAMERDIQTFRAEPGHELFEDVREDMAALLQSGYVQNLQEAYDRAVWANPATRSKAIEAARKAESAKAAEAAAKAKQAASLNVKSTPAATAPPKTPRETMAAVFDRMAS